MSLNRFSPRRDANEPAIRKRFAYHGWHTEQLSGSGMPDLMAFNLHSIFNKGVRLVDVKMPDGKATKAQEKKWAELHAKGIPVYVVRTGADVDALVSGELAAWEPVVAGSILTPRPHADVRRTRDAVREFERKRKANPDYDRKYRELRHGYTPPRSKPVDAAKEAEETFAPGPEVGSEAWARGYRAAPCTCTREQPCAIHSVIP